MGVSTDDETGIICHLNCVRQHMPLLSVNEMIPYESPAGHSGLRKLWTSRLLTKNPSLQGKCISESIVTAGLTHGISLTAQLFCNPNDIVLVNDLRWDNYDHIFHDIHGAIIQSVPTYIKGEIDILQYLYAMDPLPLEQRVILILNFPLNPIGFTPTTSQVETFALQLHQRAVNGRRVVIVCDDAYFGLFHDENCFNESIFARLCDLHENILVCKVDGVSKEDYGWGLRLGFLTFGTKSNDDAYDVYQDLNVKAVAALRASVSTVNHAIQSIYYHVYQSPDYMKEKKLLDVQIQLKYTAVVETLEALPDMATFFNILPFNSGYFLCLEPLFATAQDFRQSLLTQGIGVTALHDRIIRVCYSTVPTEEIGDLFQLILRTAQDEAFPEQENYNS